MRWLATCNILRHPEIISLAAYRCERSLSGSWSLKRFSLLDVHLLFTSQPMDPPVWKILHHHYEDFKAGYGEHGEKQYGAFRPMANEVVEEYLKCGDMHQGFARVCCTNPECKNEYILAFSCNGRWSCPSCHEKKRFTSARTSPTTSSIAARIVNIRLTPFRSLKLVRIICVV